MRTCGQWCCWVVTGCLLVLLGGCRPSAPVEVPAGSPAEQAAARVRSAAESNKVAVAVAEVMQAAPTPELVPVLRAVVLSAPEAAEACARAAAGARPEWVASCVFAVVQAAPDFAPQIVSGACQAQPGQFAAVAAAAGQAAPLRSHSIVLALSDTLPDLRDPLERAKTLVGKGRTSHPSVPVLIQQTVELIEADHVREAGRPGGQP